RGLLPVAETAALVIGDPAITTAVQTREKGPPPGGGPFLPRVRLTRVQSDSVPRRLVRVHGAAFAGRTFGRSTGGCGLGAPDLADVAEQILGGRRNLLLGSSALAQLIEPVHRDDDDEVDA